MQTDYFVTMEYRKTVRGCQGHICFTLAEETQFLVIKNQSGTVRPKACSILQHFLMRFLDGAKPPSISFCTIQYMEEYGGCSNGLVPTLCWKLCSASQSTLGLCHGTKAKLQSIPALVAVLSADGVQRFVYTVYTYSQKRKKRHLLIVWSVSLAVSSYSTALWSAFYSSLCFRSSMARCLLVKPSKLIGNRSRFSKELSEVYDSLGRHVHSEFGLIACKRASEAFRNGSED